jgi:hypothetical protein
MIAGLICCLYLSISLFYYYLSISPEKEFSIMKRFTILVGMAALVFVGVASAQTHGGEWTFELPKFLEPPELDGVRGTEEWLNTLGPLECSPQSIQADGEKFGWLDVETKNTPVSHDQLGTWEDEDPAVATTEFDKKTETWQAWDDFGLYHIHEIRDNVRDPGNPEGNPQAWWERDSVSIYIDLTNANEEGAPYVSLNIVNHVAAPLGASAVTVTWERTEAGERASTQDPDLIADIEYAFRDAGNEFGGEEDYVIEGILPWDTFMMFNLPAVPEPGAIMGWAWLYTDPDGEPGYGGQLQCWGHADNPITFADFVFTDKPAGPGSGTAVVEDSWGSVKATFGL